MTLSKLTHPHGGLRTSLIVASSAVVGAISYSICSSLLRSLRQGHGKEAKTTEEKQEPSNDGPKPSPENDQASARALVWDSIGGALKASQLYLGDRLRLYATLRDACDEPGSSVTAKDLADRTGLNQRWLREWMAQQAAMGVLTLLPGEGDDDASLRYRLPKAMADVLADEDSEHYDISMVQLVPALVERARTTLPRAFETGIGQPYDSKDISEAIDRQHRTHVKHVLFKEIIPAMLDGAILRRLEAGAKVADVGCGGGGLLIQFAKAFPKSEFHGFEVSQEAVDLAKFQVGKYRVPNVVIHGVDEAVDDERAAFDVVLTYDVLHDATSPMDIISAVKRALKPASGVWILGDMLSMSSLRGNVTNNPAAAISYALSTCLCMSCGLSSPGGSGLGTLGFTIPVARKMLGEAGFGTVEVVLEKNLVRWFMVHD